VHGRQGGGGGLAVVCGGKEIGRPVRIASQQQEGGGASLSTSPSFGEYGSCASTAAPVLSATVLPAWPRRHRWLLRLVGRLDGDSQDPTTTTITRSAFLRRGSSQLFRSPCVTLGHLSKSY
jgi:hypothetical protein